MRRISLAALSLLVLGACASPFVEVAPEQGPGGPDRALAAPADPAPDGTGADGANGSGRTRKTGNNDGRGNQKRQGPDEADGVLEEPSSPSGPPFRTLASVADPSGDAGDEAPAYADGLALTIGEDGSSARIVVQVAGEIPLQTGRTEVVGLGVDLYRDAGDYQLFASGEPDGWFGYLYTPDGVVAFQGSFEIAGDRLIFTVPWSAIGGRGPGAFGLFIDWTGSRDRFSQDVAPGSGRATFEP